MNGPTSQPKTVSVVPGATLQFLDLAFALESVGKLRRHFWEYSVEERRGGATAPSSSCCWGGRRSMSRAPRSGG
ncbi:MAG: hypothetical protein FJX67_07205 [Alphaproteobacteria bacterium]|nr:hypothetical protein [Alphaproteobacteria bacterium]